jgi:hypothetical protein
MILKFTKYRKSFTAVILASYLLLVSISILHYHHINIQAGNYAIANNSNSNSFDAFDKLDDITHECTIQHFTETIINYNFLSVLNVIKETSVQNISFKEIIRLTQSPVDYNNPLRAPPVNS